MGAAHAVRGPRVATPRSADKLGAMSASPLAMPQPGDRIGPYRLVSVAGQGGMGVVYRAADTLLNNRAVAVKVMAAHLSSGDAYRAAFLHEAQVAAEVSHPNVVPVHAAGEDGGLLYLAMAWIEGDDLRELARAGAIGNDGVIEAVRQVARALDALHEAGIVHGDVKPSNVIIHRGSGDGHAYLVDFGVARRVNYADPRTNELVGGTPAYAAPESLRGTPGPASDQYALGCVLFELLTGDKPFGTGSATVMAARHERAPRPRLSEFAPRLAYLDEVVARAMAVDPAQRYRTGAAFSYALDAAQRAAAGAPTTTHESFAGIPANTADPDGTDPLAGPTAPLHTAPMADDRTPPAGFPVVTADPGPLPPIGDPVSGILPPAPVAAPAPVDDADVTAIRSGPPSPPGSGEATPASGRPFAAPDSEAALGAVGGPPQGPIFGHPGSPPMGPQPPVPRSSKGKVWAVVLGSLALVAAIAGIGWFAVGALLGDDDSKTVGAKTAKTQKTPTPKAKKKTPSATTPGSSGGTKRPSTSAGGTGDPVDTDALTDESGSGESNSTGSSSGDSSADEGVREDLFGDELMARDKTDMVRLITRYGQALNDGDADLLREIMSYEVVRIGSDGASGACVTDRGSNAALARWKSQFASIDGYYVTPPSKNEVQVLGDTSGATADFHIGDQESKALRFEAERSTVDGRWRITKVVAPCRRG